MNISKTIREIRKKRQRPRRAIIAWMRRNPMWYREAIAEEWEKQTGETMETLLFASTGSA